MSVCAFVCVCLCVSVCVLGYFFKGMNVQEEMNGFKVTLSSGRMTWITFTDVMSTSMATGLLSRIQKKIKQNGLEGFKAKQTEEFSTMLESLMLNTNNVVALKMIENGGVSKMMIEAKNVRRPEYANSNELFVIHPNAFMDGVTFECKVVRMVKLLNMIVNTEGVRHEKAELIALSVYLMSANDSCNGRRIGEVDLDDVWKEYPLGFVSTLSFMSTHSFMNMFPLTFATRPRLEGTNSFVKLMLNAGS